MNSKLIVGTFGTSKIKSISSLKCWDKIDDSTILFDCIHKTGLTLENFIPLVDYKERAQQWRWIGSGRDSDDILAPLCKHWLENKDELSLDVGDRADAATPPPRW